MNKQMNTYFAAASTACPASMLRQETSSFTTTPRRADYSIMKMLTHISRILRCDIASVRQHSEATPNERGSEEWNRMKSKSNAMAENFSRYFALSSPLLGVLVGLLAAFVLNH
jgi:hypothetical protein